MKINKRHRQSERGIALMIAIMAVLLITAVGVGMIFMSNLETNISANFRDEQVAFFASRAGIEEVRDRLRTSATNSLNSSLPSALPGSTNGVLYVLNPTGAETVAPWTATNAYADTEICSEVACTSGAPAGTPWYTSTSSSTSYAATPVLTWKWARVTVKTNSTASGTARVDGSTSATNANYRICWNGTNEVTTTLANCGGNADVYSVTALAVTASGTRRMVQYEVTKNMSVPVVAALYTQLSTDTGQALNVTGNTDPVCSSPSTYGAASGTSTVTTPGGGNVTGAPSGTVNNYGWPFGNMSGLTGPLQAQSTSITTVPGITGGSGNPPNYTLSTGLLGVPPVVTYNGGGAISSITTPGTPTVYATPSLTGTGGSPPPVGTLTLGGVGTGVSGQGVLIVNGNLTLDVSHGFNYYGLILVTGNMTMIAPSGNVNPHIHGAIIVGGTFTAPISNFGGSISIHQNSCFVQNSLGPQFYKTLAVREKTN
jgi:CRISPR-associated DxTHG motif protein